MWGPRIGTLKQKDPPLPLRKISTGPSRKSIKTLLPSSSLTTNHIVCSLYRSLNIAIILGDMICSEWSKGTVVVVTGSKWKQWAERLFQSPGICSKMAYMHSIENFLPWTTIFFPCRNLYGIFQDPGSDSDYLCFTLHKISFPTMSFHLSKTNGLAWLST